MTASANITQTAVSGKYGRVFISSLTSGLFTVNFRRWMIDPKTENIDQTGGEDAGWENGTTGVVGAEIELEGPYQVNRSGGLPAPGMQLLIAGQRLVYELYVTHTDYGPTYGTLMRFTGVGQVLGHPVTQETRGGTDTTVRLISRGPIYLPGVTAPEVATQLALYSSGIAG